MQMISIGISLFSMAKGLTAFQMFRKFHFFGSFVRFLSNLLWISSRVIALSCYDALFSSQTTGPYRKRILNGKNVVIKLDAFGPIYF